MANPLIIVESPAKAKTLGRFLGGKYDIRASMGHVRDLPKSTLGIDVQQARRVIDRLVGYKLSPLLWKKIRKGLSAGRVQSVAVRLVCEREEEIEKFVPVESWTLDAMLSKVDLPQRVFAARLLSKQGSEDKLELTQEGQVREIIGQLEGASYKVLSIETKDSTRNAPPPYKTSTLQQDASNRLRLKPNRTMSLAQQLYEGVELGTQGPVGLITYMRTDSFRISDEASTAARHFITEQYGPTYARRDKVELKDLPPLSIDELLNLQELKPEQHFTQPPPRYTEASLIKALEEFGVGRPSTFAPTVEVIQTRHYVRQEERRLFPTELGKTVNGWLIEHFPEIVDVKFTAGMEEELDDVEEGRRKWVPIVREFFKPFSKTLTKAEATARVKVPMRETGEDCPKCKEEGRNGRLVYRMSRLGEFIGCSLYPECDYIKGREGQEKAPPPEPTGEPCPRCGKPLVKRTGKRGPFVACSGYPKCRYVKREIDPADIVPDRVCPKCGKPLLNRKGRFGSFIGCSGYPDCRYIEGGKRTVTPPAASELLLDDPCPRCGKPQVMRTGRYGEFKSCSDYPTCKPERAARTSAGRGRGPRTRKPTAPAA